MVHLLLNTLLEARIRLADLFLMSLTDITLGTELLTKMVEGSPLGNLYRVSNDPLSWPSVAMFFLLRIW